MENAVWIVATVVSLAAAVLVRPQPQRVPVRVRARVNRSARS
jgi:hypothetical protein